MEDITLSSLLDVIGELFSDEISIAVSNTKEYIYYRPSKRIDLKISAGDPIKEGTIAHKAMVTKQKVSEFINRDIFGIPYLGTAVPFLYNENLEGCLVAIYPALTDGKSVVTLKTTDGWIPIPFFNLMSDNMEVFKQYNDNDSFKKWLSDMVFALTYNTDGDVYSGSPKIS